MEVLSMYDVKRIEALRFIAQLTAIDGDQIGHSLQLVERLHVAVDNRNIVAATTQHTRQVATHLTDS